jgi:pimeloyl-ACP methyl ester carboxylesterase
MKEKSISANGVNIWTQCFGEGNRKTIILIAGAMAPAVFYPTVFCEKLSDAGFRVIRYDNRDIGHSTHFTPARDNNEAAPYSIDDMAEDVKSVFDAYNADRSVIVGHSLGGTIATLFALSNPQTVESLFLLSSPIIAVGSNVYQKTDPAIMGAMWEVLMSNKMYPDFERGKDEFFRAWRFLNGKRPLNEDMAVEYTKRLYATETIEPAYNHTKVQGGIRDVYDELKALPCPIHFIYGEDDYLAASATNTKILADSLANADFTLLSDAGHMYFDIDIWDEILNLITLPKPFNFALEATRGGCKNLDD